MTTTIDEQEYSKLYDLFERECRRVEVYKSRALTKNLRLRAEYRECLVRTYNGILNFLNPQINLVSENDKIVFQTKIVTNLKRLKECFQILGLEYTFDTNIKSY